MSFCKTTISNDDSTRVAATFEWVHLAANFSNTEATAGLTNRVNFANYKS